MSEQLWAVVEADGTTSNIIVADQEFIDQLKADIPVDNVDTGDYHSGQTFHDVTDLDPQPAVGWILSGSTWLVPEEMSSDVGSIPPDGTTAATVTYKDNRPGASGDVVFIINGAEQAPEPLGADGTAQIQVVSQTAGDTVSVSCGGTGLSIEVTNG